MRTEPAGLRPEARTAGSHLLLAGEPDAPALIAGAETIGYAELSERVRERADELGGTRRLVLLEAANEVESVVTYLAALDGRHPVLLTAPGPFARGEELLERYRPDVVQRAGTGTLEPLREGSLHDLHPELAVLMSTSGSTGSPKLVRLSRTNVVENARSIAAYLALGPADRGITSLPLHYCYGLSVLNSHLLSGAGVVLTDLSVLDECFWGLAERAGVSGLAGVPYTFDLLERSGFRERRLPSLRYLTQAGGRMDPRLVRSYAELGRERGFDLFVMYGQTEATARMAYLPPDLAAAHPEAVGIAVPGGRLRLDRTRTGSDGEEGELVYAGPNVMMGYAEHPGQLAEGPSLRELHTGDLARRTSAGLYEIVGRIGRDAKVLGLRVDLDRVEAGLEGRGCPGRLVARPDRLWVVTARPAELDATARAVRELTGLPPTAVRAVPVAELPVTAAGKPDRAALDALVERSPAGDAQPKAPTPGEEATSAEELRELYAVVLDRPDATVEDSFVDLDGDSLSYVEVSAALAERLGALPRGWPSLSPRQLAGASPEQPAGASSVPRRGRWTVPVDVSVLLRAAAITFILISHADIVLLYGGSHILLAVAGYNLARFQLVRPGRLARVRAIRRVVLAVAIPASLWTGGVILAGGAYAWPTALFLNSAVGSDTWDVNWQLWFIEALVWSFTGLALLLAVPAIDRWERRRPFTAAMGVLALALAVRYAWVGVMAEGTERHTAGVVFWFVALGWAAAVARSRPQRGALVAVAVLGTLGFFGQFNREAIAIGGIVLLVLLADRSFPVPRALAPVLGILASASLWIYLTHWQVYPDLEAAGHPVLAVLASIAVGVATHRLYLAASPRVVRLSRRLIPTTRRGLRLSRRPGRRASPPGPAR